MSVFATAGSALFPLVKRYWRLVALIVAVGAGWIAFSSWRDNLVEAADRRGFERAEHEYKAAVTAANKIVEHDNATMQLMAGLIGGLAAQRTQAIDLKVTPHLERIKDEVSRDPRYRDCAVSDGVLDDANAIRATVDAAVTASNPRIDRPRP